MRKSLFVEVAVRPDTSSKERGDVLERLVRRLLDALNYVVEDQVRLTGMEVDLLATEKMTGERILVECKAYRSNIPADMIYKLLGQVMGRGFSAGWLISTYDFSKDAKGFCDEWSFRAPEERRKLQVYGPDKLIDRLVSSGIICSFEMLEKPKGIKLSEEVYLILTQNGEYWATPVLERETGMRQSALLYNAHNGSPVSEEGILSYISQTDTSLANLKWLPYTSFIKSENNTNLQEELQSIVRVPVADHWADYRPARPEDFVGRDEVISGVYSLLDRVRTSSTRTRLFAIKAPSGWGKSSCVLKIAAVTERPRNRKRSFVFAVDCRAAATRRFGEMALFRTFQEAIQQGFVSDPGEFSFGSVNSPFSTKSMSSILVELKEKGKVICLVFDQFEELLYKEELSSVFDEIKALCNSIDESQENVVIGFSWKTGGVIPEGHRAYFLWHSLADRRIEFELAPFTVHEVATALNRFGNELGYPLVPQLKRLLQDHCQGYPWLLKKLCIHIMNQIRIGYEQSDILVKSLSIHELFQKDIDSLSGAQIACLKSVAAEAPAEFFKITDLYGEDVVADLLNIRLIVKIGHRLNIYWDIFRDYLLTGKTPQIPVTYVPQANYRRYLQALSFVVDMKEVSYRSLAEELDLSDGATYNIIRDLVSVGNAEANRRSEIISALQEDEVTAAQTVRGFCRSHIAYQKIISDIGVGGTFSEAQFIDLIGEIPSIAATTKRTSEMYAQRLIRWFLGVNLIQPNEKKYLVKESAVLGLVYFNNGGRYFRRGENIFLGEAPPVKVVRALDDARKTRMPRNDLIARHGRNTVLALANLGFPSVYIRKIEEEKTPSLILVRESALKAPGITVAMQALDEDGNVSGATIGRQVADILGKTWSEGSLKRYGHALRQWAIWVRSGQINEGNGTNQCLQERDQE